MRYKKYILLKNSIVQTFYYTREWFVHEGTLYLIISNFKGDSSVMEEESFIEIITPNSKLGETWEI